MDSKHKQHWGEYTKKKEKKNKKWVKRKLEELGRSQMTAMNPVTVKYRRDVCNLFECWTVIYNIPSLTDGTWWKRQPE